MAISSPGASHALSVSSSPVAVLPSGSGQPSSDAAGGGVAESMHAPADSVEGGSGYADASATDWDKKDSGEGELPVEMSRGLLYLTIVTTLLCLAAWYICGALASMMLLPADYMPRDDLYRNLTEEAWEFLPPMNATYYTDPFRTWRFAKNNDDWRWLLVLGPSYIVIFLAMWIIILIIAMTPAAGGWGVKNIRSRLSRLFQLLHEQPEVNIFMLSSPSILGWLYFGGGLAMLVTIAVSHSYGKVCWPPADVAPPTFTLYTSTDSGEYVGTVEVGAVKRGYYRDPYCAEMFSYKLRKLHFRPWLYQDIPETDRWWNSSDPSWGLFEGTFCEIQTSPVAGVTVCPVLRVLLGYFVVMMVFVAIGITWQVSRVTIDKLKRRIGGLQNVNKESYEMRQESMAFADDLLKGMDPTPYWIKVVISPVVIFSILYVAILWHCFEEYYSDQAKLIVSSFLLRFSLYPRISTKDPYPVPSFRSNELPVLACIFVTACIVAIPAHFLLYEGFYRTLSYSRYRMQYLSIKLRDAATADTKSLKMAKEYMTHWLCARNFILRNDVLVLLRTTTPFVTSLVLIVVTLTTLVVSAGFARHSMPTVVLILLNCITTYLYITLFMMISQFLRFYECTVVQKRLLLLHKAQVSTMTGHYKAFTDQEDHVKEYIEHIDRLYDFLEKYDGAPEILGFPIRPSFMSSLQAAFIPFLLACVNVAVKPK